MVFKGLNMVELLITVLSQNLHVLKSLNMFDL